MESLFAARYVASEWIKKLPCGEGIKVSGMDSFVWFELNMFQWSSNGELLMDVLLLLHAILFFIGLRLS
jgi:hypothetical protein